MQELPLLCRRLLEQRSELDEAHVLTFTETDMSAYAKECVAARIAAAERKKPPHRPSENVGVAWRGSKTR
jgi:hypothetical protein